MSMALSCAEIEMGFERVFAIKTDRPQEGSKDRKEGEIPQNREVTHSRHPYI